MLDVEFLLLFLLSCGRLYRRLEGCLFCQCSRLFITTTARTLSAGKIVTEVSLARSLSAFLFQWWCCFVEEGANCWWQVNEDLIRYFSACGSWSMPDLIEETIWGTGKLLGVIAKLNSKLRLDAECSLSNRGLSEIFTIHLSVRLVSHVWGRGKMFWSFLLWLSLLRSAFHCDLCLIVWRRLLKDSLLIISRSSLNATCISNVTLYRLLLKICVITELGIIFKSSGSPQRK